LCPTPGARVASTPGDRGSAPFVLFRLPQKFAPMSMIAQPQTLARQATLQGEDVTVASPARLASRRLSLLGLLKPHRKAFLLALLVVAVEAVTDLLEPWPLKIVLDHLLQGKRAPTWLTKGVDWVGHDKLAVLNFAVMAVAVIAVVGALSSYVEKSITTTIGQKVMRDLRLTLYHHIHRLSLAQHDTKRTGDLISRVTTDIDAIQDFVTSAVLGMAVSVLTLLGMVGVMFWLDWRFTLISLSVAPALFAVVFVLTKRIKKASRAVRKNESALVSLVQEVFSSIRVVKAFAREDYEEHRLEKQTAENIALARRARGIKMLLSPLVEVIVAVGTCLVLGYGARLVLAGQITAGALVVFLLYLGKMYKPMRDLSKMTDSMSKASIGFERVREVLDADATMEDGPSARPARRFVGRVEFDHVAFGYLPGQEVLRDVSLSVEPGKIAAFVGPTGSGKSTLISLVARFYDPVRGVVRIDGADVRNYTIQSLRDQVSFVLQETVLFHAPIWQNIAYGRPDATHEEIVRAARLANADGFISAMPAGYDTLVGERGVTLSGGQRQRIAIARAVVRDAPLLLLDEPTSGLDAIAERTVFEAFDRLMRGRTTIVIAHHLATVRHAHAIYVVKDGTIVEQGTHEQLFAANGFYHQLYETQARAEANGS
jgi:subfamily B ATP-binding cassette protein MsbA